VGGLALIVQVVQPEATAVWLPGLKHEALFVQLEQHFLTYVNWRNSPRDSDLRSLWLLSLDSLIAWSWDVALSNVLPLLGEAPRVHLICVGLLSLIPWHAVQGELSGNETQALDRAFLYAPSARGLAAARQAQKIPKEKGLLAIGGPSQDDEESALYGLRLDALVATSYFGRSLYIEGEATSRSSLLAALPDFPVLHFSCHGRVDANDPLRSGLILYNGEKITLGDLLNIRLNRTDLVILSACESGISGLILPDELISLPTGLLQAGTAGIIASLWAVDDTATVFLMVRFYEAWEVEGHDPAIALALAQDWMRKTSNGEKEAYLKTFSQRNSPVLPHEVLEALSTDLLLRDPVRHDFEHIHFWGGFAYIGA
jgi:hypothetical protein